MHPLTSSPRPWPAALGLSLGLLAGLALPAMPPKAKRVRFNTVPSGQAVPALDLEQAACLSAYRQDLVNMAYPMFLDLSVEGQVLADRLGLGVEVLRVDPTAPKDDGRRPLRLLTYLNEDCLDDFSPYALLASHRHFSVVRFTRDLEDGDPAACEAPTYYQVECAEELGYVEAGESRADGTVRPVPGDGHCLISALWFLRHERFPDAAQIHGLRQLIAGDLENDQILEAVGGIRADLLRDPAQFPLVEGRFATLGPALSAWLMQSPGFLAAREASLAEHRSTLLAGTAPVPMALEEASAGAPQALAEACVDEEEALQTAIALSLALASGDGAEDGTAPA